MRPWITVTSTRSLMTTVVFPTSPTLRLGARDWFPARSPSRSLLLPFSPPITPLSRQTNRTNSKGTSIQCASIDNSQVLQEVYAQLLLVKIFPWHMYMRNLRFFLDESRFFSSFYRKRVFLLLRLKLNISISKIISLNFQNFHMTCQMMT